jgi:hypothetical protein
LLFGAIGGRVRRWTVFVVALITTGVMLLGYLLWTGPFGRGTGH